MKRAQGETVDARALASTIDEADARVDRAQAGFWPRVDVTETVQRGNHPVFAFSSLLSQRRFTAADFAIASLNHARRAGLCRWSLSFWWGTGSATWADDRTTPAERIPAVNARQADRWAFLSIETERITVGR
jgi:outer membrane protein TolC